MAERARTAELIVRPGGQDALLIDGKEFPFDIVADTLQLVTSNGTSAVLVTIPVSDLVITRYEMPDPTPAPPPDEWEVGKLLFVREGGPFPPSKVWAFEDSSCTSTLQYLIRIGEGDSWTWATHVPESRSDLIGWTGDRGWTDILDTHEGATLGVLRVD